MRARSAAMLFAVAAAVVGLAAGGGGSPAPVYKDASRSVDARVADLLSRMTLAEKIGQMTQVERIYVADPRDLATYGIGSVLSGGGSDPTPNTPAAWADMVDGFQRAALGSRLGIPILYGVDAVHGDNNVRGATIFPHNIGLGATRDPALVERIGHAVAEEVVGTGVRWTFAPCVCVARNERWGRTYESFGETPALVSAMTSEITGFQGRTLGGSPVSILATAKHYVGDGGTVGGVDRGDTRIPLARLERVHLAPYAAAVRRGVGSVMASFSSFRGVPMHANRYLLTTVLKRQLDFTGFVVSDWGAVSLLDGEPGLTSDEVAAAIDAGIDMVMVPDDYRGFIQLVRYDVGIGKIPVSRIDDAVRRILRVKFRLGLFEHPYADRSYLRTVGSPAHRALARQAVRESLVLLKNAGRALPLRRDERILVAGANANDIGNQVGGWTISWQGSSGPTTPGTTIFEGIREVAGKQARVDYSPDGSGAKGYDVAVAVLGEKPYAELLGDRRAPDAMTLGEADLATLARLEQAHVPIVLVLVSGRPLVITSELPHLRAVVAAWLPGTEGGGVADVLFGVYRPTGKLPQTWPRSASQIPINVGDTPYRPLFPYGFGLSYPPN